MLKSHKDPTKSGFNSLNDTKASYWSSHWDHIHRPVVLCSLLSDHSSKLLPPQTEQMKSQMRNEGLYLILASCVRILSKKPGETANPANLSFVLVWSPPCKWSAPIKKIWFPVPVSVFISVRCFQGKKKHSLTHIFLNKQFVLGYVWCKAFLLRDIHFYTPEGKQQTRKKQTR